MNARRCLSTLRPGTMYRVADYVYLVLSNSPLPHFDDVRQLMLMHFGPGSRTFPRTCIRNLDYVTVIREPHDAA